jgi:hypothetical protein
MDQDPAISGLIDKAILYLEAIVLVNLVRDEVTTRLPQTDEHAIASHEAWLNVRLLIRGRDIAMPPGKIFPVEE